ncbi:hypothetical protein SODG_004647 [Sodalis praecaptivus]|nr:hypothetical protein NVIRENTERO_02941 [Sodalis praecaptivus]
MSDFHQNGIIANFHNLSDRKVEELETELIGFSRKRKRGLSFLRYFPNSRGRHSPIS